MGKLTTRRLPAFSLPETIVALVIILGVFGLGVVVLTGTGRTHLSVEQLNAVNLLEQYADSTRTQRLWTSDSVVMGTFVLRRKVETYPGYDSLLQIHYYIYDTNRKLLADWQSLVRADE
jgi:type II secretory pathway pseudopilin PulG